MKRMVSIVLSALLLSAAVLPLSAGAAEPVSYNELGAYIASEFEKTHIPGMSVQVVDGEKVLFSGTYGNCTGVDAPFIVGSISKSFTAAAILQLVEQGKVDLDRPYTDYLPGVGGGSKTTVRQLLNQTSGISTYSTLERFTSADTTAPWEYANVNYGLLGKIVEQVSGQDYGAYIEQHIFAPLGMEHSFTSLEEAKLNGLTGGYRNYFGLMVEQEMPYPQGEVAGWLNLPSAYIISSAEDMGRYLQFWLNGGQGVLSRESVETIMGDTVFAQEGYQYGMGWGLDQRGGAPICTHGGNVENYTTNMQILPGEGVGIIVMFNACDYFVSNAMALQLSYNIAYKLMGEKTDDIGALTYFQNHAVIDGILLAILVVAVLPLLRLKKWCRKRRERLSAGSVVFAVLVHAALPTAILTAVMLAGIPMDAVRGFAPDIFLVQVVSSAILYLTGGFKLVYCIGTRRVRRAA